MDYKSVVLVYDTTEWRELNYDDTFWNEKYFIIRSKNFDNLSGLSIYKGRAQISLELNHNYSIRHVIRTYLHVYNLLQGCHTGLKSGSAELIGSSGVILGVFRDFNIRTGGYRVPSRDLIDIG